jgi:enoyl-CoA hydratase
MAFTTNLVESAQADGVGWLTFNNPSKLNAISHDMIVSAIEILQGFESLDSVRVVIMRGAGEKAFISGGDISTFASQRQDAEADRSVRELQERLHRTMETLSKPVIAMIHGYCLGGGLAVALSADIRFASSTTKLGIPAAQRGIVYPLQGLSRLVRLTGPSVAKDLMFSGRRVEAAEALQLRLVNRVFETDMLEKETIAYANTLAGNAPLSIRASKVFIDQIELLPAEQDGPRMQAMIDAARESEDFREATRAFLEKRPPVFRGV